MTQIFKLARVLPLLALALALGGCDRADLTEPGTNADPIAAPIALSYSSAFRGGIPFGVFHLPKEQYGSTYNGSLGNIYPKYLLDYLETARRTGTRVILSLPSSENNFRNPDKSFSISMWKKQVDRFREVDFSSYIKDGTVVGHYILDEPHDPANWGGKTIPLATVDEMAKYSKELWPTLPTIVRGWPAFLKGYNYKYLDAAWAQYSDRFGPVSDFIRNNVRDAKASGLALVVGMNQLAGGSKEGLTGFYSGKYAMAASELESWGNTLLADPYPCAFISWKFDPEYLGRSDIKAAMVKLSEKARNHQARSCRAAGSAEPELEEAPPSPPAVPVEDDDDDESESPNPNDGGSSNLDPDDDEDGSADPSPAAIQLQVTGLAEKQAHRLTLTWSGASGSAVDVYRNGVLIKTTENDRRYVNLRGFTGAATPASYVYKLCEEGTSRCSNEAIVAVPGPGSAPQPAPAPAPQAPAEPQPEASIKLSVSGQAEKQMHRLTLTWSGANGPAVDVYRNGVLIKTTENDQRYVNLRHFNGAATAATYTYKLCERGISRCSNEARVSVK